MNAKNKQGEWIDCGTLESIEVFRLFKKKGSSPVYILKGNDGSEIVFGEIEFKAIQKFKEMSQ